jgi:polysaccharide biosynthesis protein PslH
VAGAVGGVSSRGDRRPRLLFLCQTVPYPLDGGVWIRTYHVLRLLTRAFDVTALCFERLGSAGADGVGHDGSAPEALTRLARVEVFPVPQRHSRARYAWDHVRSAVGGRVYTRYLFESRTYRARVAALMGSEGYDLVHMDSLDLVAYLPACRSVPVVCVHHNVESELLRRRAAVERHPGRRYYLDYQASLMEREERRWCPRVGLNVVVSEDDRVRLERLAPTARTAIVPNGVDLDEFQPDEREGSGVAFIGGTHWFPNLDALDFFCDAILPRLRAARPDLPVRWVGSASAEQRSRYRERHGVDLTGHVPDVRPFMREAACHVVPLRAGGGTRLKILNAWAMGKAVVSTSVGCEGLAAVDGENILVRDDPQAFAAAIVEVLADAHLRRRLGGAARATATRLYSWDAIGLPMIEAYRKLAQVTVP